MPPFINMKSQKLSYMSTLKKWVIPTAGHLFNINCIIKLANFSVRFILFSLVKKRNEKLHSKTQKPLFNE